MKKLLLFLVALSFSACFFSCSKDAPEVVPIKTVEEFLSPNNGAVVLLAQSQTVIFRWVNPSSSDKYAIVFDNVNGDFSNPVKRVLSDENGTAASVSISHAEFDAMLVGMGVGFGETRSLMWKVVTISGSSEVLSTKSRTIRFTRSEEVFDIPTTTLIWGNATEVGSSLAQGIEMTKIGSGQFEIFTKLNAGSSFKFTDNSNSQTPKTYLISQGKIKSGETGTTVSKTAVYRINLDFRTGTSSIKEVVSFGLFYAIQGAETIPLEYQGLGKWAGEGYVSFTREVWGPEVRYKFQMKLLEGAVASTIHWGQSSGSTMKEVATGQWDGNWGFPMDLDRANVIATVSLTGENYTHSFEKITLGQTFWQESADASTKSFLSGFWNNNGHFNNDIYGNFNQYGYWPEAHAIDVVIDAYSRTKGDASKSADNNLYKQRIYSFHDGVKAKNGNSFWNSFYDDMAWHGLAHLRAFEATGDERYEASAKQLWQWILVGWDETDHGGIRWNSGSDGAGKGVPTNGPATIIGVRRWVKYADTETQMGETNLQWATKIYNWIQNNRYVAETGRVYEDLNNKEQDWSYNFGTFMGANIEFYNLTHDQAYLDEAIKIADYALANKVQGNTQVFSDWAEQPDHDVNLFKAIFIRYFTQLIMHPDLPLSKRAEYVKFMKHNANYLWNTGSIKKPYILYNFAWYRRAHVSEAFLNAQISGAELIEAIALLEKEGLLQ